MHKEVGLANKVVEQLIRNLGVTHDTVAVAEQVIAAVFRLLRTGSLAMGLVEPDGKSVRMIAAQGALKDMLGHVKPAGGGLGWLALQSRRPVIVPDLTKEERALWPEGMQTPAMSACVVPMSVVEQRPLGVLLALKANKEPFDEREVNNMALVANVAASTLERIRSRQALEAELANNRVLLRLSELLEGSTVEDVRAALEEVRRIAGAEVAVVVRQEGAFSRPRLMAGDIPLKLAREMTEGMPIEYARAVVEQMGTDYQALDDGDHPLAPAMRKFGVKASLVVPLNPAGSPETLVFHRLGERRGWSEAEHDLLRTAARTLGVVIGRLERVEALEARNRELEVLAALGEALRGTSTPGEVAARLIEQTIRLVKSQHAAVLMVSADGSHLERVAQAGHFATHPQVWVPRGEGLSWLAIETHENVVVADTSKASGLFLPSGISQPQGKFAQVTVPIFDSQGVPLGVLISGRDLPAAYDEADLRVMKIMADVAASALERVSASESLLAQVAEKQALLELAQLAERGGAEALSKALERTRQLAGADLVMAAVIEGGSLRVHGQAGQPFASLEPSRFDLGVLRELGIPTQGRTHIPDSRLHPRLAPLARAGIASMYVSSDAFEPEGVSGLTFFRRKAQPWSEGQRRLMDGAAQLVGALVARRDALGRLENQLLETRTLLRTVEALGTGRPEQVWPQLLEAAVKIVPGSQTGSIFLADGDGYRMVAQYGYTDELLGLWLGPEVKEFWFGSEDQLKEGKPRIGRRDFVLGAVAHDRQHIPPGEADLLIGNGGLESMQCTLCVPVVVRGEMLAYFNLDNHTDEMAINEVSVSTARNFAVQIAALLASR